MKDHLPQINQQDSIQKTIADRDNSDLSTNDSFENIDNHIHPNSQKQYLNDKLCIDNIDDKTYNASFLSLDSQDDINNTGSTYSLDAVNQIDCYCCSNCNNNQFFLKPIIKNDQSIHSKHQNATSVIYPSVIKIVRKLIIVYESLSPSNQHIRNHLLYFKLLADLELYFETNNNLFALNFSEYLMEQLFAKKQFQREQQRWYDKTIYCQQFLAQIWLIFVFKINIKEIWAIINIYLLAIITSQYLTSQQDVDVDVDLINQLICKADNQLAAKMSSKLRHLQELAQSIKNSNLLMQKKDKIDQKKMIKINDLTSSNIILQYLIQDEQQKYKLSIIQLDIDKKYGNYLGLTKSKLSVVIDSSMSSIYQAILRMKSDCQAIFRMYRGRVLDIACSAVSTKPLQIIENLNPTVSFDICTTVTNKFASIYFSVVQIINCRYYPLFNLRQKTNFNQSNKILVNCPKSMANVVQAFINVLQKLNKLVSSYQLQLQWTIFNKTFPSLNIVSYKIKDIQLIDKQIIIQCIDDHAGQSAMVSIKIASQSRQMVSIESSQNKHQSQIIDQARQVTLSIRSQFNISLFENHFNNNSLISMIDDQYSCIGLFIAIWIGKGNAPLYFTTSTAFLTSRYQLVTCSHAVQDDDGRQCSYFAFLPGCLQSIVSKSIKLIKFNKSKIVTTRDEIGTIQRQFMLINLQQPVQKVRSFLTFITKKDLINDKLKMIGYPQSKVSIKEGSNTIDIKYAPRKIQEGKILSMNQQKCVIQHQLSTDRGMSGSPLLGQYKDDKNQTKWGVIGINVRKTVKLEYQNIGLLLAERILKKLQSLNSFM